MRLASWAKTLERGRGGVKIYKLHFSLVIDLTFHANLVHLL